MSIQPQKSELSGEWLLPLLPLSRITDHPPVIGIMKLMNNKLRIFFSGIGGSGLSAIAGFMADRGHEVHGSDRAFDTGSRHPAYGPLTSKGITIVPQDGKGIDSSFDLVVFSTAVEQDQPEHIRAKELGIPMRTRPEYLAEIVSAFRTTAVAGTSGKSTTSGMLAFLMDALGMAPNFIGGGRVKQFRTPANPGNALTGKSDILVIEACESDGSIVHYRPENTLLLNLDIDHHGIDETAGMFKTLMENTRGMITANADDPRLTDILPPEAILFSITNPSPYRAEGLELLPLQSAFSVQGVRFSLQLPGRHNILNALACIAALAELGIPLQETAAALAGFTGIERRFDIHLNTEAGIVIDDYAHNPHKIAALMAAVRPVRERVCYIFQPHGFGPTKMMKDGYIRAFSENLRDGDHLILLPIYYAGGTAGRDISSRDLAEGIQLQGRSVETIEDRSEIITKAGQWDCFVVLGARDESLSILASDIAKALREQANCNPVENKR
jgi:UDP-N-acetylmuramate--alanine ligase